MMRAADSSLALRYLPLSSRHRSGPRGAQKRRKAGGRGKERRKIRIMPMVGWDYHDIDHSLRSAPQAVAVPGSGEAERGGNKQKCEQYIMYVSSSCYHDDERSCQGQAVKLQNFFQALQSVPAPSPFMTRRIFASSLTSLPLDGADRSGPRGTHRLGAEERLFKVRQDNDRVDGNLRSYVERTVHQPHRSRIHVPSSCSAVYMVRASFVGCFREHSFASLSLWAFRLFSRFYPCISPLGVNISQLSWNSPANLSFVNHRRVLLSAAYSSAGNKAIRVTSTERTMLFSRICFLFGLTAVCEGKDWKGSARLSPSKPWVPLTSFAFDLGAGKVFHLSLVWQVV